ncbi:MAG TPA: NAD+ synthase [Verrucomicrobiae bacterium]|nr:NAD+ synthase [Verrucomicrobiae bacterium]
MKTQRLALGQTNPTAGDYPGNARKIIQWIRKAEKAGASLAVFPEMALCGYPVWDLANKKAFVAEGLKWLDRVARATSGLKVAVALGFIDRPDLTPGVKTEPKTRDKVSHFIPASLPATYNAMAWIQGGKVRQKQYKRLLPTYDVFLEEIFFEPGPASRVIPWQGKKVGLTICEDIWDDRYAVKPLDDLQKMGADMALNISASPYYRGVSEVRDALIKRQALRHKMPLLYVNQVGAQDDLIFDGRSLFADEDGRILFRAPAFQEGLFFYDWKQSAEAAGALGGDPLSRQPKEMYEALCLGVADYCRKNRFERVIIGLSGGIDSALVAALAVDALGPDAVLGVTMPGVYSSRGSWEDSAALAENLGIELRKHSIREKYEFFMKRYQAHRKKEGRRPVPRGKITLAMENLQARLRGLGLMYLSNDESRLLLTTGNKSELAMGYCTLYGDMAGGLAVIGDVYKTDVYRLAMYRNSLKKVIPEAILTKAPSAELRPNQKDQDSLPPYEILDEILYLYIEKNLSADEILPLLRKRGVRPPLVNSVIRKVDHNEYKRRQTPPILRVTEKAWFGRRMPITNRFDP